MIVAKLSRKRSGLTAIAVLICLLIVTLISGAILKVCLAHRGQMKDREHRLQAEWLAESGLDRARARLAADHGYTGETWSVSARDLGRPEQTGTASDDQPRAAAAAALVTIKVEAVSGAAGRRQIRVQADYPADPPRRARHTKRMLIDLAPTKNGDPS